MQTAMVPALILTIACCCGDDPATGQSSGTIDSDTSGSGTPSTSGSPTSSTTGSGTTPSTDDSDNDGWSITDGDCDDSDPDWHPEAAPPDLPDDKCALGEPLDIDMAPTAWTVASEYGQTVPTTLRAADDGCGGAVLAIDHGLDGPYADGSCCWAVVRHPLASTVDLSEAGFLTFPFRGEDGATTDFAVEIKLEDTAGCATLARFDNAADLPAWRPPLLSLASFGRDGAGQGACTTDLSQVAAVQVAVSTPDGPDAGTLLVGVPRVMDRADLDSSALEHHACVADTQQDWKDELSESWAQTVLANQSALGHGVLASWDGESPARYYLYTQALHLMVLSRAGETEAATAAADALATGLPTRAGGTWPDFWEGDTLTADSNTSTWVGNLAWGILGLHVFLESTDPAVPTPYQDVMVTQADALVAEIAEVDLGGGITAGTEGNVSAWFALRAAAQHIEDPSYTDAADQIAAFLLTELWDPAEGRFWMGLDDPRLALDVVGSWGARFLGALGMAAEAHAALALGVGAFAVRDWDDSFTGLGDIAGPWQPAVEFTAQHIAAGGPGAQLLLDELFTIPRDGLHFPASPDDFDGGAGWNTAWTGVSPTAWVWLAMDGGVLVDL